MVADRDVRDDLQRRRGLDELAVDSVGELTDERVGLRHALQQFRARPAFRWRAARLARWARQGKVAKSDVIRALIDRAGPIETGDDLIEWVGQAVGKGLGFAQDKS